MSSTVQDPPDHILMAVLGESILSAVVETSTFTLIYGARFGPYFLEMQTVNNMLYRGIRTLVFADSCGLHVSGASYYS